MRFEVGTNNNNGIENKPYHILGEKEASNKNNNNKRSNDDLYF